MVTVSTVFRCRSLQLVGGPTTPAGRCHSAGLGSSAFARHYLRNHYYFLFLRVMRCFSSPRSPPLRIPAYAGGLPHSDIRGSMGICPSPRLFAAYHVLLRLREPQASPVRPYLLSFLLFAFFEYDLQSLLFWPAPPCPCGLGVQAGSIALEFS